MADTTVFKGPKITEFEINRKPGKNSKTIFFFPTIEGKRINRINFARRYDAVSAGKIYVAYFNKLRGY